MRHAATVLATLLPASLSTLHAAVPAKAPALPNILVILADDLGDGDVGRSTPRRSVAVESRG